MNETKYKTNALTPFIAMENIDIFNKSAVEYGLPSQYTFQSGELYEGTKGTFSKVIDCLNQLGCLVSTHI